MSSTLSSDLLPSRRRGSITKLTQPACAYRRASLPSANMTWSLTSVCNIVNNVIFPIIPRTTQGFVAFLFWHSMIMTISTPLSRMLSRTESWYGKLIIPSIMNSLGLSDLLFGHTLNDVCLAYPKSASIDRAFIPHAICGMLWLIMAYLHICQSKNLQKYINRKALSYGASVAFVSHIFCCIRGLWLDPMGHHPLSKVMLLSSAIRATQYFIAGVKEAKNGSLKGHESAMTNCFLHSIEGAGTIRTVAHILTLLGKGPAICQQENNALASNCVWSYCLRLMCISMLTYYYKGVVANMKGPNKQKRWESYKNEAIVQFIIFSVITAIFSLFNNAEEITAYAPILFVCNLLYPYICQAVTIAYRFPHKHFESKLKD